MPSAQHVEIDEPLGRSGGGSTDLHSFLGEINSLNIRNLDSLHGRGSVLFAEGEPARGVYVLRTGRAAVSISSREGRIVTLRMVQAGDVLGLNAVLRDSTYEATVKTLEPSRVNFISRAELIALVENSDTGAVAVMRLLSRELAQLTERARSLLLPQTAGARLAQLLLQWSKEPQENNSRSRVIDKVFTHEEVAQMIGSSRETVTRLLASLSRKEIIRITSDSIVIRDLAALEEISDNRHSKAPD
jgi:CRP/FNR family transcriptional regulator, cyclic AMP receptor protein